MKNFFSVLALAVLLSPSSLLAAVSEADLAALKAQVVLLANRVEALEAENRELRKPEPDSRPTAKASWTDRIALKGDFRYRYENIDLEGTDDRTRNRIRARASLTADLPENVSVGLGIASGGDDPVSTNQTLGGGGSSKDLKLDLAYARWQPVDGLALVGGKFKNVWYKPLKSQLIFDGDFNPEGVGLQFQREHLFISAAGTWLESDTRGSNESYSWGAQLGFTGEVGDAVFTAGGGYYNLDTAGKQAFFGDDTDFFGNAFDCADPGDTDTCTYVYDYNLVQAFADMSLSVGKLPLRLYVDYVVNTDADDEDTAYGLGFTLGKASAANSWQVGYRYQDKEADAVLGLLTDSDFGGGGTDVLGHAFSGSFAVNKQWILSLTYFLNEVGGSTGDERDFKRVMIDTQFKY